MKYQVDDINYGGQFDVPEWNLPPGVMTDGLNMRYRDGAAEKMKGWAQVLGDLSATALYALDAVSDGQDIFYIYGSDTVLYGTNGTSHTAITTITYAAGLDLGFNGGFYHGFYVFTEGSTDPGYWQPSMANKAHALTGWPASHTCEIIRPFRDFLVALKVDEGAGANKRLLRWSESALSGNLPGSWDYTDPANDSGRTELGQTSDNLVDCLPLRNANVVYKEHHTWMMEFIGGSNVMNFRQVFTQVGLLAKQCVAPFKNMHFLVTDNDFVLHDGNEAQSVLDRKMRKWWLDQLDSDNYERSFVLADYRNREMTLFYPTTGSSWPDAGLVWNWQENNVYPRDTGKPMARGVTALLPAPAPEGIGSASGTYDQQQETFDGAGYNAAEQYMVTSQVSANAAVQFGNGEDYGGTQMSVYAERQYMALDKDVKTFKRVMRVLPWVDGTTGDTITITVYTRDEIGAARSSEATTFTIGTDYKAEFRISGRLLDIRFTYAGTNPVRIYGYDVEYEREGLR